MIVELLAQPLVSRVATALLMASLAMTASLSPPLVNAASKPLIVQDEARAELAGSGAKTEASEAESDAPVDLSRELDNIAAELRLLRPYGEDAPSLSRVLAGVGEMNPHNISYRLRAKVSELGDFELRVRDEWQRELEDMQARGLDASLVAAHRAGLNEFLQRAVMFRALIAELDAPATRESTDATANGLLRLADFFAEQQSSRTYRAIDKDKLAIRFADGKATPAPMSADLAPGETIKAANDPPVPADLAQTIDVQISPAVMALAESLGDPVSIRNWVYNNIAFTPTWGSIQGSDLTLLNRVGNAHDIASLTLALLRHQGVPARYVHSVVEVPVEQLRNWVGNPETPGMAVDLFQSGGVPSNAVMSGGSITAIRFEHVWVEAWLDFIPSRGAKNRVPDQWVPFDVAFKQYQYHPGSDWRKTAFAPKREMLLNQFVQDVTIDNTGGISGFNFDRVNDSLETMAEQLAGQISSQDPTLKGDYLYPTREILPIDDRVFAGTLPFPLRSQTVLRYSELPDRFRHVVKLGFYADESALRFETPTREAIIPLAQIGNQRLYAEYEGSTPADVAALQSYADSNAEVLPIGSLNVVPKLKLGSQTLFTGNGGRMGVQQFWTADLRNAVGQTYSGEPYRFAAGSTIAFVPNQAGFSAERLEREHADAPDSAYLPTAEALHLGAQIYWALHDHLDEQAALSLQGQVLRMPSLGAFAQPYEVRYFFGVPRTGTQPGRVTDVKLVNAAITLKEPNNLKFAALQIGAGGSMAEGAAWNILSGTTHRSLGLSAATLIARAIDDGQRIFQIDRNNVNTALQQLQLFVDAENEIRDAALQGMIIIAHEREITQGTWSGSGYVIFNPLNGASLQRVEGGFAGGIEWGCIAMAVSLKVLCNSKFFRIAKIWLKRIAKRAATRLLARAAVLAFLGPVGAAIGLTLAIIDAVQIAMAVAYATMEVARWVRGIMDGTETLSAEDLAELGIKTVNQIACSYMPPCLSGFPGFGGGFGGGPSGGFGGPKGKGGIGPDRRGAGGPLLGNPVAAGTGAKWQTETDYEGNGRFPLEFVRVYNSQTPKHGSYIGTRWHASYFQRLDLPPDAGGELFPVNQRPESVLLWRPDGGWYQFDYRNGAYVAQSNIPGKLQRIVNAGNTTGWTYTTTQDIVERYDPWGRLLSLTDPAGLTQTVSRDAFMRPETVTDPYGRTLTFTYDEDTGYLESIADPAGRVTSYEHDEDYGNLIRATYPDNTSRQYLYEDLTNQYGLTALIDERGIRTSSWTYDSLGRVQSTERADGEERHTFEYDKDATKATDAAGNVVTYEYAKIFERPYLRKVVQPCDGCGIGSVAETTYDARGLVSSEVDFEGNRTNYTYNSRGLLEVMAEAVGTPEARETRITWHPNRTLPTQITEPASIGSRVTSFVYDEAGNIRTKTVLAGTDVRTWTYIWDQGLLKSVDGPRTDAPDIVQFTHDTQGNIATESNAVNHTIRYTDYDENGLLLSKVDPNGLETKYEYDRRDRLVATRIGPEGVGPYELTQFEYDQSGNFTKLTKPDGAFIEFGFDGANRATTLTDANGNRFEVRYNGRGNPTQLNLIDPQDRVLLTRENVYDNLGRLEQVIGADNQTTKLGYDNNGNLTSIEDPNNIEITSHYDALGRLSRHVDALENEIHYAYDAQDNLKSYTDARGLETIHRYNGFDQLVTLSSPDTGQTSYTYDANGNLRSRTDARQSILTNRYDSLNRLVTSTFADEEVVFTYDDPSAGPGAKGRMSSAYSSSIGALSSAIDTKVAYRYDLHGRVIGKVQTVTDSLAGDRIKEVKYLYDSEGKLVRVTMPSGTVIEYEFSADGRTRAIKANGQLVISDIEYFPMGKLKSWRYGGNAFRREFDLDGRIINHTLGSRTRTLEYDPGSRVTAVNDGVGSITDWQYGYDRVDRLTSARNQATSGSLATVLQQLSYNDNGSRTANTQTVGAGGSVSENYIIDPASNRLNSIAGKARAYDPSGNTIGWVAERGTHVGQQLEAIYNGRNRWVKTIVGGSVIQHHAYDPFGKRIATWHGTYTANAPNLQFVYDESGRLIGEYGISALPGSQEAAAEATIAEHVWLDDTPVAVLTRDDNTHNGMLIAQGNATYPNAPARIAYFVHPDHLDTPRVIVNAENKAVWLWSSLPFGESDADETPTTAEGIGDAANILLPFTYTLRFAGQRYDQVIGTAYNFYRDYDADAGRYVQADPIGLAGGIDLYSYAYSDPLTFIDPFGLAPTTGTLRRCGKPDKELTSEKQPPRAGKYDDRDPDVALTHVEGQAANMLDPGEEGFLEISHPLGPCGFCRNGVSRILKPGSRLHVKWPGGSGTFTNSGYTAN